MKPTDTSNPDYFHKVVDCQWACPAHTPVPEYIRLIAAGRYPEAYLVNWESNVFPGILGRTCDRPCEPACRRSRVEDGQKKEPVAICRLKRVAADHKGGVAALMPSPLPHNGKRVACVGAGPASLTVARDLALQGYAVTVFDGAPKTGGFMRTQIPKFRLPEAIIDEESDFVLRLGVEFKKHHEIKSLRALLTQHFDAIFIGSGAPRGRDLPLHGRNEAAAFIHIGIDWLASVAFGHVTNVGKRVIVLGGGNTAMDCCRTARRLGGEQVHVVVRSGYDEMKASPWEKEDAEHEGVHIRNFLSPKSFEHRNGQLTAMFFEPVHAVYDDKGQRQLIPTGDDDVRIECDEVMIAVGQENAYPWIERDLGLQFERHMPVVNKETLQSTLPTVFFGGDAAFGPKNIIWAVAHGHIAAVSIDKFCHGEDIAQRPLPQTRLLSQKMGLHEWSYDNAITPEKRHKVPLRDLASSLSDRLVEVELGFDETLAVKEAARCLNCDVQTVFNAPKCIECDACVDICPMDCITFTAPHDDRDLRQQLRAPALNLAQDLYVSEAMKTGRIMVKDEDVCLHCGLCAERCPTGAWDMHKFFLSTTKAGGGCRDKIINT